MLNLINKNILIKNTSTSIYNKFYNFKFNTLILTRERRKSMFDQAHLNPYHIPVKKSKNSKPTQDKFTDENYKIPYILPAVKQSGKELMAIIHAEELAAYKKQGLKKDKINLGDKIEVEYYHSITSKKLYKYKGVIIALKRQNSPTFSFRYVTQVAGSYAIVEYPYYSPMLHSVKVLSKGDLKKTRERTKIYNLRYVNQFGNRITELMKGGKSVNVNKSQLKELRLKESKEESIIIE